MVHLNHNNVNFVISFEPLEAFPVVSQLCGHRKFFLVSLIFQSPGTLVDSRNAFGPFKRRFLSGTAWEHFKALGFNISHYLCIKLWFPSPSYIMGQQLFIAICIISASGMRLE